MDDRAARGRCLRIEADCVAHFSEDAHVVVRFAEIFFPLLAQFVIDHAFERSLVDQDAAFFVFEGLQDELGNLLLVHGIPSS